MQSTAELLEEARQKLARIDQLEKAGEFTAARAAEMRRVFGVASGQLAAPFARQAPRPPLPRHYEAALRNGDEYGTGDEQTVALAAYCSGWSMNQLSEALLDSSHVSGSEYRRGAPTWQQGLLRRLWNDAENFARLQPQKAELIRARAAIERVRQAADARLWFGEDGLTDLYVLHAFLNLAERLAKRAITFSVREIAEAVAITKDTAHRARQRLSAQGWLVKLAEPRISETHSDLWALTVPGSLRNPLLYAALPPFRPEVMSSDAFGRDGLGKATLHAWRVMGAKPRGESWRVPELAEATSVSLKQTRDRATSERLGDLLKIGLVRRPSRGQYVRRGLPQYRRGLPPVRLYVRSLVDGSEGGQEKRQADYNAERDKWVARVSAAA